MKILKIILGVILALLGAQGLYAQIANSAFNIFALTINVALLALGIVLIYKTAQENKPS